MAGPHGRRVADLTAAFAIERRLVQHDRDIASGTRLFDRRAIHDEWPHRIRQDVRNQTCGSKCQLLHYKSLTLSGPPS